MGEPSKKRLIVFWKLHTMSKDVAKKAMCEGGKTYAITPQIAEFPADTDPVEAYKSIIAKHGERPEVNPFKGMSTAHTFAEITGHKIADAYEKTEIKEIKTEELSLPL